jgi:hypothetical protein
MELRKSRRYRLSAPASFFWESLDGRLREGRGTTLDISTTGTFIVTDAVPHGGAQLELNVYLPSAERAASTVQLHGEGKVVRLDQRQKSVNGFAAEVTLQAEVASGPTIPISAQPQ